MLKTFFHFHFHFGLNLHLHLHLQLNSHFALRLAHFTSLTEANVTVSHHVNDCETPLGRLTSSSNPPQGPPFSDGMTSVPNLPRYTELYT